MGFRNEKIHTYRKRKKNELAYSFIDRNTLYKNKNEIFLTHIFLDTIYKIDETKLIKYHINLDNINLPYKYAKFDSKNSYSSILDNNEEMNKYAFHYPLLMASDSFLIDGYIYKNNIPFFIFNRKTGKTIAGKELVNDIDFGIDYLAPRFIDNQNYFYTIHQYEELKSYVSRINSKNNKLKTFMDTVDPETGFIVTEYKLKYFLTKGYYEKSIKA